MKLSKDLVGKTIYAAPTGNNARRWDGVLKKFEVVAVKRKYFELRPAGWNSTDNYCPVTGATQGAINSVYSLNSGYKFYLTHEEYTEWKDMDTLRNDLYKAFSRGYCLPEYIDDAAARQISDIIAKCKEKSDG